jgi:hypothetical protein
MLARQESACARANPAVRMSHATVCAQAFGDSAPEHGMGGKEKYDEC